MRLENDKSEPSSSVQGRWFWAAFLISCRH
jgi:hypothetical protein